MQEDTQESQLGGQSRQVGGLKMLGVHRGSDCSRTQEKIVASSFIDIFWVKTMDDIIQNIRNLKVWG